MLFQSSLAQRGFFPLLFCVLALYSCGGNISTSSDNSSPSPAISASSAAPGASALPSATPSAKVSSSPLPTGDMAVGSKPQNGECSKKNPIKGNIGKRGKIYHLPDSKRYAKVKAEACFTTTAEAEQAGFQAPKQRSEDSTTTP